MFEKLIVSHIGKTVSGLFRCLKVLHHISIIIIIIIIIGYRSKLM